jgi:hypothetical protein
VPTYVVLLRGINLGSKRRVAMADLRELLEGLGYDDVRTHLQSGNVVLRTHRLRGRGEEEGRGGARDAARLRRRRRRAHQGSSWTR